MGEAESLDSDGEIRKLERQGQRQEEKATCWVKGRLRHERGSDARLWRDEAREETAKNIP